jgi:hypothetical protein
MRTGTIKARACLFIALAQLCTLAKPALIAKAGFIGCFIDYNVPGWLCARSFI